MHFLNGYTPLPAHYIIKTNGTVLKGGDGQPLKLPTQQAAMDEIQAASDMGFDTSSIRLEIIPVFKCPDPEGN